MTDAASYFESRLAHDPKRAALWRTLCEEVFQPLVGDGATVVELGAGWCDFINNIQADRRVAVDLWEGVRDQAESGVHTHVGSATDLEFLEDRSVDLVFVSNLLEHLTHEENEALLREALRVLRDDGRFVIVQPNYRLNPSRYFDDYTHITVWSDVGLRDFLVASGFEIERTQARFTPLSVKSRLPVAPWLIRLYLRSPVKPLAGQMLLVARPRRTQDFGAASAADDEA